MIRNWVNRAAGKTWRPSGFRAGSLKQAAATSKGEKRSLLAAKEAEGGTTIAATCQHSFEPPRNPTRWLLWTKLWNARGGRKGMSMSGGDCVGTLVLSIDLELDIDHHDGKLERRLDEVRSQLVGMTRAAAIPATWAVADPTLSAASESILAAACGHEIAVLGNQAWLGPGCGRARLARELARRFSAPRNLGIPVSTLSLRNVDQVPHLDLLLDYGVTALCSLPVEHLSLARKLGQPPIRFGLWQPPAAWKLPPRANWWSPAAWLFRREIKRVIRQRSLLHLRVDASRLVGAPDQAMDVIATMFRYVAAKRDAGQLAIQTVAHLAAQALRDRAAIPSRSILRQAA